MKFYFFLELLTLSLLSFNISAQESAIPNREFRGVWVSTVFSLDWPKTDGESAQKAELTTLLDKIRDANLNAVLLQVRTECDAFYASAYEPWSRYLTGTQGQDPGYDPLAFAIEEAHKRGLELHAWMNPFRVNASTSTSVGYSDDHVSVTHPEWTLDFSNGKKILNPALPEVRAYIASVVKDVVDNYEVDGIHFDDYFYPYPSDGFPGITNEDADDFVTYGDGFSDIKDWRRDNINQTVRLVYNEIKNVKAGVRFGISPFGIWRNGIPEGIIGLDAYNTIYADAPHWLQNHSVDYITPQLYWPIGGNQDFKKLLEWWAGKAFDASRHLYSGHSLGNISNSSRVSARSIAIMESFENRSKPEKNNARSAQSVGEVPNQIAIVRNNTDKNALGSVFFKATNLTANPDGFTDYLKTNTYALPAAPPIMDWLPEMKPAAPENLVYQIEESSGNAKLEWSRSSENTFSFKRYIVYKLADALGTIPSSGAIYDIRGSENVEIPYPDIPTGLSYWGVAALGLTNDASELSNIITIEKIVPLPDIPVITLPSETGSATTEKYIRFEWEAQAGIVAYHYQLSANSSFTALLEENSNLEGTSTARLFNNMDNGTYFFRIRASNEEGWSGWSETYKVDLGSQVTGISDNEYIDYLNIYPNPSSQHELLNVNLSLKKASKISFEITSMAGAQRIKLSEQKYSSGEHNNIHLDCQSLPKGIYILRLRADGFQKTKRLILN